MNQKPLVQRELVQEPKSGPDLRQQSLGFCRKGPAPCCYGDAWKVTHDKHWCVSAIWLSSLQRFLNGGQLTELGKPRKCIESINSLTGHLYSSKQSWVPLPRCARGQQGRSRELDIHFCSSFWDGLLLAVRKDQELQISQPIQLGLRSTWNYFICQCGKRKVIFSLALLSLFIKRWYFFISVKIEFCLIFSYYINIIF